MTLGTRHDARRTQLTESVSRSFDQEVHLAVQEDMTAIFAQDPWNGDRERRFTQMQ
jgi:hypothetical protein